MAIKTTTINGRPTSASLKDFICDAETDIAFLPTSTARGMMTGKLDEEHLDDPVAIGSTCLVTQTSNVYILSPDNTWKKL